MTHGFSLLARLLHWSMAVLLLIMLFVGLFMANASSAAYVKLVGIHRPLGIALLLLALLRLGNRFIIRPPALPDDLPALMALGARLSHIALYALMIVLPLVGWGMLSAGDYPITLWPGVTLPPILPHNPTLWACLRHVHAWLAYAFLAIILLHIAAAMMHGLIRRDNVLGAMLYGRTRS